MYISKRAYISYRVCVISGVCKNLSHIIFFNYKKKCHYASSIIKLRKNSDISKDN